jgi:hypothetical protein
MPTNLRAVAAGSGHIHVSWTDTNFGSANYVVSNGNVSSADIAAGSTSYDWGGLPPSTYMCFAIAAKSLGQQSPWVEWACATTRPLSGPTNLTVSVLSSYSINVTWTDPNGGDATYYVYDGAQTFTVNPPNHSTTITGYLPNEYKCFAVRAAQSGQTTGWTPYNCATTSSCPSVEPTHPACSGVGAFQQDMYNDHDTIIPPTQNDNTIYSNAYAVQALMQIPLSTAAQFFGRYLDTSCSDLNFDSTNAFWYDSGFEAAIIKMFQMRISMLGPSDTTFDSGWNSFPKVDLSQPDLGNWATEDWKNAVGHGFFRIVGTKQSDGTWLVHLQLTSYYQFRDGVNFSLPVIGKVISGTDMHRLSQVGLACPFREIGNGNVRFIIYSDGSVRPGPA